MSKKTKGPYLPNLEGLYATGFNPATGLPYKFDEEDTALKGDLKRNLRIMDKSEAVRRYVWHNLPDGITGEMIERVLYERGQGALFKLPDDNFYFLPYALDGTIDVYSRFNSITPLPFNGSSQDKNDKPLIEGLTYDCVYDVMLPEDFLKDDGTYDIDKMYEMLDKSAVILKDYTIQTSQMNVARAILDEPVIELMSDCLPFLRTALLNSTGIKGMRVGSQIEANEVFSANRAINNAALTGQWAVPVVGAVDFQELTSNGGVGRAEEFMLSLQSLDNFRLSLLGIPNGGVFGKKAHMLQSEQEINAGSSSLVLLDGLLHRQRWCDVINSLYDFGAWVDIEESITQIDKDMDGDAYADDNMNPAGDPNMTDEGGTDDDTI